MKFSTWLNGLTPDASPNGAADYVVTYDASATAPKKVLLDNLPGSGGAGTPAADFMAYGSANQTGISTTPVKVQFNTEVRDTGSHYDSVINFRWTPPAGLVDMYALLAWANTADNDAVMVRIHKNGSLRARNMISVGSNVQQYEVSVHLRDVANGTDYYEVFALSSAANDVVGDINSSYFFGTLLSW